METAQGIIQREAEHIVLGLMLEHKEMIDECYLSSNEFVTDPRHSIIFEIVKYTYDKKNKIGLTEIVESVIERSKTKKEEIETMNKIGGISYLSQLAAGVPTKTDFNYYQKIVRENHAKREYIHSLFAEIKKMENGESLSESLDAMRDAVDNLESITYANEDESITKISEASQGFIEFLEDRVENKGKIIIPSIGEEMDNLTDGLHLTDFVVTAARPSVGKTAAMINESLRSSERGDVANLIISAEMPLNQLITRYVAASTNLELNKMRNGNMENDWDKVTYAMGWLENKHIYLDETIGITVESIERKVKSLKKRLKGTGITKIVLYVDYLQLIETDKKFSTDRERVAYVSKTFKRIARRQKINVNVLAQLSRNVEGRADKRPIMSDLGDSGSIERDADVIRFLHRDDYYDKESERKNIVEIIISKQRNGAIGTVEMVMLKEYGKFVDISVGGDWR